MSSNKSFVNTIKNKLESMGKEVKTSKVYEDLSHLSGYNNWDTASASGVVFSESAQFKMKELVLAQIDSMDEKDWHKHFAKFLLNHDQKSITNLINILENNYKLTSSNQECKDLVESILQLKLNFKTFRNLTCSLVDFNVFATCLLARTEVIILMKSAEFQKFCEEESEIECPDADKDGIRFIQSKIDHNLINNISNSFERDLRSRSDWAIEQDQPLRTLGAYEVSVITGKCDLSDLMNFTSYGKEIQRTLIANPGTTIFSFYSSLNYNKKFEIAFNKYDINSLKVYVAVKASVYYINTQAPFDANYSNLEKTIAAAKLPENQIQSGTTQKDLMDLVKFLNIKDYELDEDNLHYFKEE
jgi:predicted DNA-binding ArsR family transcriptional regulator